MPQTLTVNDGDVSVLVVLWQCDWGTRDGSHSSDGPTVVRAVEVAGCHPLLVPSADSSRSACQPSPTQASAQVVGKAKWIPGAVTTVRLVDPLHHGGLVGHGGVLARQNHWLEQHSILLLISHKHLDAGAGWREDTCGRRWWRLSKVWEMFFKTIQWQLSGFRRKTLPLLLRLDWNLSFVVKLTVRL